MLISLLFIFATRSRTFMVVLQALLFFVHAKVSIMAEVTWRMGYIFMTIVSSMRSLILVGFRTVFRVFMSMFYVVIMVVMIMMMMILGRFVSIMIAMLMLLFVWWDFTIIILMMVMMIMIMMIRLIFRSRSLSRRFSVFI